jgi:hypothetical protein
MDKLCIARGITRYSSLGWEVRLFRFDPGHAPDRSIAPELRHAGLFLGFGQCLQMPQVIPRQIPLFGEEFAFPSNTLSGAIFMTAARDTLCLPDYEYLAVTLFGVTSGSSKLTPGSEAVRLEDGFKQVLADAYHLPVAA